MKSFGEIGRIARREPGGPGRDASRGLPTEAVAGGSLSRAPRRWSRARFVSSGDAGAAMPFPSFHDRGHGLTAGQRLFRDNCLTVGCMLLRVTSRLAVTRKALLISPQRSRTLEIRSYASGELGLIGLRADRAAKQAEAVHDADRFGHDIRLGAVPLANANACLLGRNEIVTLEQILVTIAGPFAIARAARFKEPRRTRVKAPLSPSGRQETTVVVGRATPRT